MVKAGAGSACPSAMQLVGTLRFARHVQGKENGAMYWALRIMQSGWYIPEP